MREADKHQPYFCVIERVGSNVSQWYSVATAPCMCRLPSGIVLIHREYTVAVYSLEMGLVHIIIGESVCVCVGGGG